MDANTLIKIRWCHETSECNETKILKYTSVSWAEENLEFDFEIAFPNEEILRKILVKRKLIPNLKHVIVDEDLYESISELEFTGYCLKYEVKTF